jgi:hypothetical protein
MAFTLGLFDKIPPESIPIWLEDLAARAKETSLTLEASDEEWAQTVTRWLKEHRSP